MLTLWLLTMAASFLSCSSTGYWLWLLFLTLLTFIFMYLHLSFSKLKKIILLIIIKDGLNNVMFLLLIPNCLPVTQTPQQEAQQAMTSYLLDFHLLKRWIITNVSKDVIKNGKPMHTIRRMSITTSIYKTVYLFRRYIIVNSTIPFLDTKPKRIRVSILKKHLHACVYLSTIPNSQDMETI